MVNILQFTVAFVEPNWWFINAAVCLSSGHNRFQFILEELKSNILALLTTTDLIIHRELGKRVLLTPKALLILHNWELARGHRKGGGFNGRYIYPLQLPVLRNTKVHLSKRVRRNILFVTRYSCLDVVVTLYYKWWWLRWCHAPEDIRELEWILGASVLCGLIY